MTSKVVFSQFRFLLDISLPFIGFAYILLGLIPRLNFILSAMLVGFFITSFLIWDIYGLVYRKLIPYRQTPISRIQVIQQSMKLFLFAPVMIVLQSIPRTIALYKYIFAVNQGVWYKTERTREKINE